MLYSQNKNRSVSTISNRHQEQNLNTSVCSVKNVKNINIEYDFNGKKIKGKYNSVEKEDLNISGDIFKKKYSFNENKPKIEKEVGSMIFNEMFFIFFS